MGKRVGKAGLALALVLVLTLAGAAASAGTPAIYVAQPRHAFAPVPEGAEVSHDFIIRNRGTAALEIQKVETG
jgi:hypothetical protein